MDTTLIFIICAGIIGIIAAFIYHDGSAERIVARHLANVEPLVDAVQDGLNDLGNAIDTMRAEHAAYRECLSVLEKALKDKTVSDEDFREIAGVEIIRANISKYGTKRYDDINDTTNTL